MQLPIINDLYTPNSLKIPYDYELLGDNKHIIMKKEYELTTKTNPSTHRPTQVYKLRVRDQMNLSVRVGALWSRVRVQS